MLVFCRVWDNYIIDKFMDGTPTPGAFQGLPDKIWILEDDPDIGFVLEVFLNQEGYHTHLLNSAEKFRRAIAASLPDLLLMDVMLPDGDGMELCVELKNNTRSRHIPVLLMSAHIGLNRVNDCHPDGFITKPFDLARVLETIRAQLGPKDI